MNVNDIIKGLSVRQKHARCLAKIKDISWDKVITLFLGNKNMGVRGTLRYLWGRCCLLLVPHLFSHICCGGAKGYTWDWMVNFFCAL